MKALAMLREPFHLRARAAVAPPGQIAIRSGVVEFIDAIVGGSSDVAVVDPTLAGGSRSVSDSLVSAHLGTVLYITLTPEYAQAAVKMIRALGSGDIVTYGYTDDPTTFAGKLRKQSRASRHEYLLRALEPQISRLPPEFRSGIQTIAEQGDRINSVDSLSVLCGVTRSTLWRNLRNVGIMSTWGFVAGLSLMRDYDSLVAVGRTMKDIAHMVGLGSVRALRRRCLVVSGLSLREIRAPVSIEELARRIAVSLTTARQTTSEQQKQPQPKQRGRARAAVRAPDYSV
ncbi:MAG: hypothetical protein ABI026_06465 [Gemmatimonadaceae bacterium]